MRRILADFAPDVVHLASPSELGRRAMRAADQLDIPTVAVCQTDVPGDLGKYGLPFLEAWAWQRVIAIHQSATRTLAPSLSAARQLELHGIPRVELWGRGVDTTRVHPGKRSAAFRAKAAPNGELLIGLSAASPSRSGWKISSRSPALISSCTPVNPRPFAKQFRRRWRPECRWSRLRGADRSISSTPRAPDGSSPLAISGNFGDTSWISSGTTRHGLHSVRPPSRACRGAPGLWSESCSSTTSSARSPSTRCFCGGDENGRATGSAGGASADVATVRLFVALGDSVTADVEDPDPRLPNGVRGWADRVAEKLAKAEPGWRYANLAVRSKRLREVVTDQLEVTLRLQPTLITLYAGGNDVLDPGTEIRSILDDYEKLVAALTNTGATLLLFTGYNVPLYPVVWLFRRRNHAYNEGMRQVA